jgi:hypothetical protein
MTTLIIRQLDKSAKGSLAEMRRLLSIQRRMDVGEIGAVEEMIDYIISRARTDDGSPVEDAIAEMSFDDFIETARGMTDADGEMVPNVSTPS